MNKQARNTEATQATDKTINLSNSAARESGGAKVKTNLTSGFILKGMLTAITALTLAACGSVAPAPLADDSTPSTSDVDTINASLEMMAKLFAQAVTDKAVRQEIHSQVSKRFDGDTEALYRTLVPRKGLQAQSGSRTDIRSVLADAYRGELSGQSTGSHNAAMQALDTLTNKIPKFQIAVPVHFDSWDPASSVPLVGYAPIGIEDTKVVTIKAFDADGKMHFLNARALPSQPVVILGINERTDEAGQLQPDFLANTGEQDQEADALQLQPQACNRNVLVGWVMMRNDTEPWWKGSAEVMLVARSVVGPGVYWHGSFNEVDEKNKWYWYRRYLGCTASDVIFYWYEKDGTKFNVPLYYGKLRLGIYVDDSDDYMGAVQVPTERFNSAWSNSDLGNIFFTTN